MRWAKALCILFLTSATLFAAEDQSLYIYPITEKSTDQLISTAYLMNFLQSKYAPVLQIDGVQFHWKFDWMQNYVGAGSGYVAENKEFYIMLYGGQVRASSFEAVALTLCHEFGHFLAGPPHQRFVGQVDDWSSAEGQADWFAANECLPSVFEKFQTEHSDLLIYNDAKVTQKLCSDSKNAKRCQWILGAGLSFAQMADHIYEKDLIQPSLLKQAPEVVEKTLSTQYPSLQCRLDTFKEATFCLDRDCIRPSCWFKSE